jgi:hypothetical protein
MCTGVLGACSQYVRKKIRNVRPGKPAMSNVNICQQKKLWRAGVLILGSGSEADPNPQRNTKLIRFSNLIERFTASAWAVRVGIVAARGGVDDDDPPVPRPPAKKKKPADKKTDASESDVMLLPQDHWLLGLAATQSFRLETNLCGTNDPTGREEGMRDAGGDGRWGAGGLGKMVKKWWRRRRKRKSESIDRITLVHIFG